MATKAFPNTFHERKRNSNERWESSPNKKKQTGNGSGILLIQAKIRDRSDSLDLIPACVPQSVGLEIENILHTSFGHDLGPKQPKKRSSPKKKSPRSMSTEDLPPNMLPEDYLDEVISQYFNNDSSSDDQDSRQLSRPRRRESLKNYPSDNSSNEEEEEQESDEKHDDNDNPVDNKTKIKTDEEMESEYKHIIFGAKKRKGPRIGFGSPKKNKKKTKEKSDLKPKQATPVPQSKPEKSIVKHEVKQEESKGKKKVSAAIHK